MNEALNETSRQSFLVDNTTIFNALPNSNPNDSSGIELLSQKVEDLFEGYLNISNEVAQIRQEQLMLRNSRSPEFFQKEGGGRGVKERNMSSACKEDDLQECEKIIHRAVQVMDDWSETEDIKLQIQYATLVIGKITNIRKTNYVQSNEIKVKICTLLKNTIRLNVTEEVFSKQQISLLKKGITLILEKDVEKKALLELNRNIITEGLMTMPAWE